MIIGNNDTLKFNKIKLNVKIILPYTKFYKNVVGTFIGKMQGRNLPFEGKMNNFELRHHNDYVVASVNLDKATFQEAIEFKSMIDDEIEKGYHNIVISMNDCDFLDSAFVGVLVVIWKKVKIRGGSLKLVKPGNFNHSVLHLTGAIEIFEKYDSVLEALASSTTTA